MVASGRRGTPNAGLAQTPRERVWTAILIAIACVAAAACIVLSILSLISDDGAGGTPLLEAQAAVVGGFLAIFSAFLVFVIQNSVTANAPHLLDRIVSDRPSRFAAAYLLGILLWDFTFIALDPTKYVLAAALNLGVGMAALLVLLVWRALMMLEIARLTRITRVELERIFDKEPSAEPHQLRSIDPKGADEFNDGVVRLAGMGKTAVQRDDHDAAIHVADELACLGETLLQRYGGTPSIPDEHTTAISEQLLTLGRMGHSTERSWLTRGCIDAVLSVAITQARLPLGPPGSPVEAMAGLGEGGTAEPWAATLTRLANECTYRADHTPPRAKRPKSPCAGTPDDRTTIARASAPTRGRRLG